MLLTRGSIAAFVLLLLSLAFQSGGAKVDHAQSPLPPFDAVQPDTASIRRILVAFGEAVAFGEIERLEPLLAESVIEMAMNRPPIEGRDAVLRWWKAVVSQRSEGQERAEFTMSVAEVVVTGDWAHAWGTFAETVAPLFGDEPEEKNFKFLAIFERVP